MQTKLKDVKEYSDNSLTPCPRCHEYPNVIRFDYGSEYIYHVACPSCHSTTSGYLFQHLAIREWNSNLVGTKKG